MLTPSTTKTCLTALEKSNLDRWYDRQRNELSQVEILDYREDFQEVTLLGDYAFEWGTLRGMARTEKGDINPFSYKILRILKREHDEWKFHRSIWNANPEVSDNLYPVRNK